MYIVGITGNVAVGKSQVGKLLREMNFRVIDLDQVSREVVSQNEKELARKFPILAENAQFSKDNLKNVVYNRRPESEQIEKYLHRKIFLKTLWLIFEAAIRADTVIFIEIPLFFEYKLDFFLDSILVVTDIHQRAKRLYRRDGGAFFQQKLKILDKQESKVERATYVINNSGLLDETKEQLKRIDFYGYSVYTIFLTFVLGLMWCKYIAGVIYCRYLVE